MKATDAPAFLWDLVRPPRCECDFIFEQDVTEFHKDAKDGRLAVKCGNKDCGKTWKFGAWRSGAGA